MLRKILSRIQKLEQQKEIKKNKQEEIQKEIDELDITLKKLYSFRKEYEKLEASSTKLLNDINEGVIGQGNEKKKIKKGWQMKKRALLLL